MFLRFEEPFYLPRLFRFYLCVVSVDGSYVLRWVEVIVKYL